jgi:hypothetical protein
MPFDQLHRREFILLLGGAAACPLAARGQPSGKNYRIGFLGVTSYPEYEGRRVDALLAGLRQLGYEEGRNIVIHYRWVPVFGNDDLKSNIQVL